MLFLLALGAAARSDKWASKAPLPEPRSDLTCTVVDDVVYCIGGCSADQACPHDNMLANATSWDFGDYCYCPATSASVFAYTPATDTWVTKTSAPRARYRHAAAALDGKLYLFGGRTDQDALIPEVDVYTVATDTWTTETVTGTDLLLSDSGAFVFGGKIYIAGGWTGDYSAASTQVLVFENGALTAGPVMTHARGDVAAVASADAAFVFGGFSHLDSDDTDARGPFCDAVSHLEVFDGTAWSTKSAMGFARGDKAAVAIDGPAAEVYAVGGEDKHDEDHLCDKVSAPVEHVERYDPVADAWERITDLPTVRMRFAAASVDGSLYLFGGQGPLREKSDGTNEHPLLNVVEAYRPCSDGVQNGDEEGVDCGGSCQPCTPGVPDSGSAVAAFALLLLAQ